MGDSVSPPPMTSELAPIAEFDKTPPTPPEDQPPSQQAAAEEEEDASGSTVVEQQEQAIVEKASTVVAMDDLPPPPASAGSANTATAVSVAEEKEAEAHRHYEEENEWGCGSWLEYTLVVVLASILLLGSLALTLFWVIYYHDGFAWRDDVRKQFNLHPVLMVAGFITFSGFSILLYRICRCCRRIYVKLLHTVFHALAIPCVAIGFLAVLDSHNLNKPEPIPNFYSLHSWIGLVTMGLFAIQFVVGFFSFLVLLCCEGATAAFRAALVPIHASFGLTTFMLAIAACLTGLTEKVIFTLGARYGNLPEEGIVMNAIAMVLVALAILVGYILQRDEFRFRAHVLIRSGDI